MAREGEGGGMTCAFLAPCSWTASGVTMIFRRGRRLEARPDFSEVVVLGRTVTRLDVDILHIGGAILGGPTVMPVVSCGDIGKVLVWSRR